jgi:Holliday junction DNA helicase RuvA
VVARGATGVIALLTGLVVSLEPDRCVIDVHGVGYLVQASTRTLAALPAPPAPARVLVETLVREDAILLFGFADAAERDWFRLLTTVQGVGAKVALGILSALSAAELAGSIATGDRAALTRAPGVGPKLAIRLLTELRDKAGAMPTGSALEVQQAAPTTGVAADALSALANLGYRRAEAQPAVERALAAAGGEATLDILLRSSLRDLAK